jgi:F-type H+-transporting ATPase subunit alpha
VIVIYAGTKGYLDKIEVKDVTKYEMGLLQHLRTNCKDLLDDLTKSDRKVDGDLEDKIKAELEKFTTSFG